MSVYLIPITAAMLIFPFLAALFTIPYIIVQYRRYGSILFLRVLIIYSFIFYLLCAYFLVSLPLPPIEEVQHYTKPIMQLIPFKSLMEFTTSTSLVWNDPATYLTAYNEPSLYLIIFNVLLTVPFGVYLRYYFQYSWKKTLLGSFMLSLSFECLQLSALFGIYPRPYRLFDVDDLITNSFGGMCGYVLTPIFVHFLPTRSKLDEEAFQKGQQVTSMRSRCLLQRCSIYPYCFFSALLCMYKILYDYNFPSNTPCFLWLSCVFCYPTIVYFAYFYQRLDLR